MRESGGGDVHFRGAIPCVYAAPLDVLRSLRGCGSAGTAPSGHPATNGVFELEASDVDEEGGADESNDDPEGSLDPFLQHPGKASFLELFLNPLEQFPSPVSGRAF